MDTLSHLASGFAAALSPAYFTYAFAGCVLGTLIGVLPGLGPAAGTAILIPLTFKLDATGAIIMLAAIYYGAMYGGTITSVLINVPGEAASMITCLDGHQMAKQGRAGTALGIAAIGSFIGGTVATIALALIAPPLARVRAQVRPAGILRADAPGAVPGERPRRALARGGRADDRARAAGLDDRHRPGARRAALRVRRRRPL